MLTQPWWWADTRGVRVGNRGPIWILAALGLFLVSGCSPSHQDLAEENSSVVRNFCIDCHNDIDLTGNLSLEGLDIGAAHEEAEIWEQVVRKLRGGMMPPEGPRPDPETYLALIEFLEEELNANYEPIFQPPGMHRLNRAEYANAIRDLLALDVDASEFLPADDSSNGFDNQAGSLGLSPALLEAYLSAAGKLSRRAIGSATTPTQVTYRAAVDGSQDYHVPGLPFGTRGGLLIEHHFPVSAEYDIKIVPITLGNMGNTRPFGEVDNERLMVFLDGEEVEQIEWDSAFAGGFSGGVPTISLRIPVEAGPHSLGVTFLASNYAPTLDLNNAFERSTIETGGLPGFTFFPHIGSTRIDGPFNVVGVEDTPTRDLIFTCSPQSTAEESVCAREIVSSLARRAYRGFGTESDIEILMEFYSLGREGGGSFDDGIEMALQRALTEPKFLYRFEVDRPGMELGEAYALNDLELASRLSFFLWSSIPDDELLMAAEEGSLSDPAVYEQQVRRMIRDSRSESLTENFAGQWLALRSLDSHSPVVDQYPDFDDNLRQAFRRETELLFSSILREDRSVIDLLTADYTFVNDRLAKHYGIPGVQGSRFRRVELQGDLDVRRGLLGKGSVLTVASQPGRTSPVKRGSWVMATVLGIPPPDPPDDVPPFDPKPTDAAGNSREPSLREQMEAHRENPVCQACHNLMDPFGFALEQFDATGRWRETENGNAIDPVATMYDGFEVSGPADVREFLLRYDDQFVRNVTEKLLTYALGRGVEYSDMPVVRSIVAQAGQDENRFSTMVVSVTNSEPFRMNMKAADDN